MISITSAVSLLFRLCYKNMLKSDNEDKNLQKTWDNIKVDFC